MDKQEAVTPKSEIALKEEEILKFWKENKIFEKSLGKESPMGEFVFYDGPPFATGTPHYGHLLPGTMKDVIPRFKTMQGYHVARRWGWDCHGLPIENLVEKELGLATKKDIENFGIEKFNEAARASVLRYEQVWKETIPRVGRWVDMDDPYMSMQASYMESVWWVFSSLYEKKLITKGFKAMHLCPRCETTLANFEVNLGYKDITDLSVTAKFELLDEPGTFILAWTTTPWTLPGNIALAVGEKVEYVKVQIENEKFIVSKTLSEKVFKDKNFQILQELTGKDLLGKSYKPLFDYYSKDEKLENRQNGWKIYGGDFVTTEDGTGVVHIAPAFGSDDMELGKKNNLPFVQHVDKSGHFKPEVSHFAGLFVKPKEDHTASDVEIIKHLAHNGLLFSKEKFIHSYPHCWRCDTPLINYASTSWFLDVPHIKDKMLKNNSKTNWIPENLRDGRFGNWLEGAREWALSRSRFWGTPLPVWVDETGTDTLVVGSTEDLKKYTKKSGNKYFGMRHGYGQHMEQGVVSSIDNDSYHLTEAGKIGVAKSADHLKSKKITKIFVSPLIRTKETAYIVAEHLGIPKDQIVIDLRLREFDFGEWNGKLYSDYVTYRDNNLIDYDQKLGTASMLETKKRFGDFLYDVESKYIGENILIVTHGIFFEVAPAVVEGADNKRSTEILFEIFKKHRIQPAEVREFDFIPLPHNKNFELDLHRPYIDEIVLEKDGKKFTRIEEVFDVWFDSGSMPYAQQHYPFEKDGFNPAGGFFKKSQGFPADFIAEGLDQTRGWFYVLMVIGTALFDTSPFKNVAVNGLVLAEDGKKMSKRLKNYPELDYMINKYGADAIRLFLMASPAVRGEDVAFSEKSVQDLSSKVMGRLRNVVSFYEMYEKGEPAEPKTRHILDRWIISRLYEVIKEATTSLHHYEIDKAARVVIDFVDDLSNWYVRRSRERFKSDDIEDKQDSISTTRFVVQEIAKIMAPYTPFVADEVYRKVSHTHESVHLEAWPTAKKSDSELIKNMNTTREIVSLGLMERQKINIKVKQPLLSLTITENLPVEFLELIKDEVNVKEVVIGDEMKLNSEITDDLKQEGDFRELLRFVQSLRKDADLHPEEKIRLDITTDEKGKTIIQKFQGELKKIAGVSNISFDKKEGSELVVDDLKFTVSIEK